MGLIDFSDTPSGRLRAKVLACFGWTKEAIDGISDVIYSEGAVNFTEVPLREKLEREAEAAIEVVRNDCYRSECDCCEGGHSSFWRTVVNSPEWAKWRVEQSRRRGLLSETLDTACYSGPACYDMAEVEELGWISPEHFSDFIEFTKDQPK